MNPNLKDTGNLVADLIKKLFNNFMNGQSIKIKLIESNIKKVLYRNIIFICDDIRSLVCTEQKAKL